MFFSIVKPSLVVHMNRAQGKQHQTHKQPCDANSPGWPTFLAFDQVHIHARHGNAVAISAGQLIRPVDHFPDQG